MKKIKKLAYKKNNMCYWIAAAGFFAIILAIYFFVQMSKSKTMYYDVVVFGDSLLGLCRDETSVTAELERISGYTVYNAAMGGTCLAVQDDNQDENYIMALLNMVSLSKALAADDFGAQQTVRPRQEITKYFVDVIEELPNIDFQQAKSIVICFGLNDYHSGIPVDNPTDPYDENTYGGALRSVLRTMQAIYPKAKIVIVTPTYTWYLSNGLTCEEYDTGAAFLEEYVDKGIEIAAEFDIPVIDLYHDVYAHEEWEDWKYFTIDGLHPNEESRRMIAQKIMDMLDKIL